MSAAAVLNSLVVPAKTAHSATVIFAHGLGDSAHGWSFLAQQLGNTFPYIKWIFPNAPTIPITVNMGMEMPGWFDIKSFKPPSMDEPRIEDETGILASVKKIHDIVDEEAKTISENRIVVGGFSQGAAISLLVSLTTDRKIAGAASLSGYLPLDKKVPAMTKPHTKSTKVFMAHGTADEVLKFSWGELSYKVLKETLQMNNVIFHAYPGLAHSADPKELKDFAMWLKTVIPPDNQDGARI